MEAKNVKTFITISGAGLVLFSFIGNEIFKDTYKEKASGFAASYSTLVSRLDVLNSQEATQVAMNERALDDANSPDKSESVAFDIFMEGSREDNAKLAAIHDALKDSAEQKELLEKAADFKKQSADLQVEVIKTHNAYTFARRQHPDEPTDISDITAARMAIPTFETALQNLVKETLESIETQKVEAEKRYRRWKYMSYVLFGIGWLMNLVGAIWKIDGLEVDL